MKKVLLAVMIASSTPAYAVLTTGELLAAASCNSIADNAYFAREFESTFGKPVRNEQGALWFKASGDAYNSEIREVFVSSDPRNRFVGIVLSARPNDVVLSVPSSNMYPTNVFPSRNAWVGTDGREIMWHAGKYTKMFCTPK